MPHITLSIAADVYAMMKEHPEIKWSEVARGAIVEYLNRVGERNTGGEILGLLPSETRRALENVTEQKAREFYAKVAKKEWKRIKLLTRAS